MDPNVRPDSMERITNFELANKFIEEQVAAVRQFLCPVQLCGDPGGIEIGVCHRHKQGMGGKACGIAVRSACQSNDLQLLKELIHQIGCGICFSTHTGPGAACISAGFLTLPAEHSVFHFRTSLCSVYGAFRSQIDKQATEKVCSAEIFFFPFYRMQWGSTCTREAARLLDPVSFPARISSSSRTVQRMYPP